MKNSAVSILTNRFLRAPTSVPTSPTAKSPMKAPDVAENKSIKGMSPKVVTSLSTESSPKLDSTPSGSIPGTPPPIGANKFTVSTSTSSVLSPTSELAIRFKQQFVEDGSSTSNVEAASTSSGKASPPSPVSSKRGLMERVFGVKSKGDPSNSANTSSSSINESASSEIAASPPISDAEDSDSGKRKWMQKLHNRKYSAENIKVGGTGMITPKNVVAEVSEVGSPRTKGGDMSDEESASAEDLHARHMMLLQVLYAPQIAANGKTLNYSAVRQIQPHPPALPKPHPPAEPPVEIPRWVSIVLEFIVSMIVKYILIPLCRFSY
jgi:hypothetical protein